jgi:hypothetical protein
MVRRSNQDINNFLDVLWPDLARRRHGGAARKLEWIGQKIGKQSGSPTSKFFCSARRAEEYEKSSDAIGRLSRLLSNGAKLVGFVAPK